MMAFAINRTADAAKIACGHHGTPEHFRPQLGAYPAGWNASNRDEDLRSSFVPPTRPFEGMNMAQVTPESAMHITKVGNTLLGGAPEWNNAYGIGATVPASGIYRCTGCGEEITSNKDDKFPPQNRHQHVNQAVPVQWQLIVKTQTKA